MTDQAIADMLRERHGVGLSRETVNAVRHRLGITKLSPERAATDIDKFLAADATRGLSNKDVASQLRKRFGVEKTPNAVRLMRERRGLEPPGTHGRSLPPDQARAIDGLLRSKAYAALSDKAASRRLLDEHGLRISYESIRQLRKQF